MFVKWRRFQVGRGKGRAGFVGVLGVDTTAGASKAASATVISTVNLPANSLARLNDGLRILSTGHFATNGNNKQIQILLGDQVLYDSGVVTTSNDDWWAEVLLFRLTATSQVGINRNQAGASILVAVTANLAVDNLITVKELANVADNDAVARALVVEALTS